jgi:tRNA(Ile)-lysidine synthetase-like protein
MNMFELIDWPPAGTYILAVSGGADSMAMLDMFAHKAVERQYNLVVAHYDHGLRDNSEADRIFVEDACNHLGLKFEYEEGHLGKASEAKARNMRLNWLQKELLSHHANAIVTAHHQDDLLETSLLNLARGSGRHGLAPMLSGPILRPLINVTRKSLREYNIDHNVAWREDPTNADVSNPRNFLRHKLLPQASGKWRRAYLLHQSKLGSLNTKIDHSISTMLNQSEHSPKSYSIQRKLVRNMRLDELEELLMAAVLALDPSAQLDGRIIKELAIFCKTGSPGKTRHVRKNVLTTVQSDSVRVYYMGISKVGRR